MRRWIGQHCRAVPAAAARCGAVFAPLPRQVLCRLVDRVTVKGSIQPIRLYTYDVPPPYGTATKILESHALDDNEEGKFWQLFRPVSRVPVQMWRGEPTRRADCGMGRADSPCSRGGGRAQSRCRCTTT